MPKFINYSENYLLITSYKVMYSTLKTQETITYASSKEVARFLLSNALKLKKPRIYALGRNPYNRLVSFYEDKFQRYPEMSYEKRVDCGHGEAWQKCQKIFFPFLDITPDSNDEDIAQALKAVSFRRFIDLLPDVRDLDPHIQPQRVSLTLKLNYAKTFPEFSKRLRPDSFIQIESSDVKILTNELKLNLALRKNSTEYKGKSCPEYFDLSLYETVNRLYRSDFELFSYKQI